jgi:HlyD family secretion protein
MLTGPATDFGYWIGRLDVKEGDMVKAGQALAELDVKRERAATLSVRRAQVQEAEVIAHFAERELARKEKLTRVISLKDLDSARNSGELAAAKLEAARRPESYAEIMLDQATIRAPVAGMILRILKHEGEGFAPGQGLIELGRVAHMEAVAEVFETNVRFVVPGQRATFKSPALAGPVQGKVLRIMPKLDRIKLYETNAGENVENRVVRLVIGLGDDPATKSLTGLQGIVTINTSRSP